MSAAELEYNNAWTANVTQQTDITVLGEDFTPDAVDADKLITVNVSTSELKQCFGFKSNWTPLTTDAEGQQELPEIILRLESAIGAKLNKVHTDLMSKTGLAANQRTFKDDVDNDISSFARVFLQEVQFTGSVFDTDIPKVAIRSIDEQDAVATQLATIVGDVATLSGSNTVIAALRSLFEQAVAANRVKHSNMATYTVDGVTYISPSFVLGDSITFYVDYSFIKTRSYTVDTDLSQISNVRAAIVALSIGGQTFTINTAATETSDTLTKRYAFKLLASSSASKWDEVVAGDPNTGIQNGGNFQLVSTTTENGMPVYTFDLNSDTYIEIPNLTSKSFKVVFTGIEPLSVYTESNGFTDFAGLIIDLFDMSTVTRINLGDVSVSTDITTGQFSNLYAPWNQVLYDFTTPLTSLTGPKYVTITVPESVSLPASNLLTIAFDTIAWR